MPRVTWHSLGDWWLEELESDPAYREEIEPLLLDLLQPRREAIYLDLGCGEGRLMKAVAATGAGVVGCDVNWALLQGSRHQGPVVRIALPDLGSIRSVSFDGALVGLVLEHLGDEAAFLAEVARVVRPGGVLAMVINHPIWTAPQSSPMEDTSGEMLWRPGLYFGRGYSDEPAGQAKVRFYHRTTATLLTTASEAGWDLEQLEERGVSSAQVERFPEYRGQEHIPRLLGGRWRRRG